VNSILTSALPSSRVDDRDAGTHKTNNKQNGRSCLQCLF
jgi:hypothetical protein